MRLKSGSGRTAAFGSSRAGSSCRAWPARHWSCGPCGGLAVPLLCFVDFPEGVRWGWASGVFIGAVYWMYRVSWMPLQSWHVGFIQFPAIVLGTVAWAVLAHF